MRSFMEMMRRLHKMHEKLKDAGCELGYLAGFLADGTFCDECRAEMLFRLAERASALADAVAEEGGGSGAE